MSVKHLRCFHAQSNYSESFSPLARILNSLSFRCSPKSRKHPKFLSFSYPPHPKSSASLTHSTSASPAGSEHGEPVWTWMTLCLLPRIVKSLGLTQMSRVFDQRPQNWQATLLACKKGTHSDPSRFFTLSTKCSLDLKCCRHHRGWLLHASHIFSSTLTSLSSFLWPSNPNTTTLVILYSLHNTCHYLISFKN